MKKLLGFIFIIIPIVVLFGCAYRFMNHADFIALIETIGTLIGIIVFVLMFITGCMLLGD